MVRIKWWILTIIVVVVLCIFYYMTVGYGDTMYDLGYAGGREDALASSSNIYRNVECPTLTEADIRALIDNYVAEMEYIMGELDTPTENPFGFLEEYIEDD